MSQGELLLSALAQGFYLSQSFQALDLETRDYREHPVLGGISSTRWNAFEAFRSENPRLTQLLSQLPASSNAVQLRIARNASQMGSPFPEGIAIQVVIGKKGALRSSGFLSGNEAGNRLKGSAQADLLMGWDGRDTLIGGRGDDLFSTGSGADRIVFHGRTLGSDVGVEHDEITDFQGANGDRIVFAWKKALLVTSFSGAAGEFMVSTGESQLSPVSPGVISPWVDSGSRLSVDRNGDGLVDLVLDLPGVPVFKERWLSVA